jgi:phospholipid/cholesterol/gamma-HCH transport system substrate-binding protein
LVNLRDQTQAILRRINTIVDRVSTTTLEVSSFVQENRAALTRLSQNLGDASERLNEVIAKIDEGRGTVGLLVNDPQPFYALRDALAAVQSLFVGPQPDASLLRIQYEQHAPNESAKNSSASSPSPGAHSQDSTRTIIPSDNSSLKKTQP